ncbi:MAG: PQQ-dependent sugar dehydrogenase [Chloroflexota bacterium]
MKKLWVRIILGLVVLVLLIAGGAFFIVSRFTNITPSLGSGGEAEIFLPPGFEITVFAEGLNGPRFAYVGPDGHLYVADRGNNRVVRLPDNNQDGVADRVEIVAEDLDRVHSLVFHEGAWYVGVPAGVIRLEDEDGDGTAESRTTLIDNYLPPGQHSTRTIEFLPDGRLLVSAGSTCNVCVEEDERRAAVTVYDSPVGQDQLTGEQIFATGLRNAVGLAINPATDELWATNNGRDLMGDDLPPEAIYIVEEGNNYGWPFCHSGDIVDPDMGSPDSCAGVEPPIATMQAHVAPLGMAFYTGDTFPEEYHGDLFIALHGSWNRSEPVGYSIVRLPLQNGELMRRPVEDFAIGWLKEDNSADGRPVDVTVGADGALYVTDDKGGFVYRIQYDG